MKIKIPGRGPFTIYSDTNTYIEIPGDGPISIVEAAGGDAHPGSNMFMEDGFNLLLETGDAFLMEA